MRHSPKLTTVISGIVAKIRVPRSRLPEKIRENGIR